MNQVILIGNLSSDPTHSTTPNGISRCSFRMATQRKYANPQTGQREADFHNIVVWRQLADLCAKYLTKGRKCAVRGLIQYRSYTGQDGKTHSVTEVVAEEVKFLDSRQQEAAAPSAPEMPTTPEGYIPVEPDELPF